MYFDNYAEIDLRALANNIGEMKNLIGTSEIMAVLKADAYGQKATEIFKALIKQGIEKFAVANLLEAMELRKVNQEVEILVFGRVPRENLKIAIENGIALSVYSRESWEELKKILIKNPTAKRVTVHVKINTGFNRLGFNPNGGSLSVIKEIGFFTGIFLEGVYSHFALVDLESDREQYRLFTKFVRQLEDEGLKIPIHHMADSIAAVDYPWARMDMVRLGAVMYGLKTDRKSYEKLNLKGTMKFYASISQIRDIDCGEGIGYDYLYRAEKKMKIATLTFGYADGYPKSLGNKGYVIIDGRRANILGVLCMDQCVADVTDIGEAKVGDRVLVYEIDTDSEVSLAKICLIAGTNKNDILASLAKRVARVYKNGEASYSVNQLE